MRPTSVVDLDGCLISIVQCTSLSSDVIAFLSVLSRLPPALAALRQLLTVGGSLDVWPQPRLGWIEEDDIPLLSVAMPIFNSIVLDGVHTSPRWAEVVTPSDAFSLPFCAFVSRWAAKVTEFDYLDSERPQNLAGYCQLLAQCTNLKRVSVQGSGREVLEAVTAPTHHVSDLFLLCMQDWTDLVAPMSRWLVSGHAMHLRLTGLGYGTGNGADLADAIATSPTLSHLYLDAPLVLLASLVGSGRRLNHITEFECAGLDDGEDFQAIFALLPLDKLTKLRLYGAHVDNTNLSWLLPRLPFMSALDDLHLSGVRMEEALLAVHPTQSSRLRSVRLPKVSFSIETRREFLVWALRSHQLECLTWPMCATDDNGWCFDGDGLRQAIEAGVRIVDLEGSFSTRDALALANVIRGAKAPHTTTLCLHHSPLRRAGELHLRKALATSTNVVITTRDADNAVRTLLAA